MKRIACIHTSPWPSVRDWPLLGQVVDGLIIVEEELTSAASAGRLGQKVAIRFHAAKPWRKRLRSRDTRDAAD